MPDCDTGKTSVGIDVVVGSIVGIIALSAFGNDESELGVAAALASGAYFLAANRGNTVVNECRSAIALERAPDPEAAREERRALRSLGPQPAARIEGMPPRPDPITDLTPPVKPADAAPFQEPSASEVSDRPAKPAEPTPKPTPKPTAARTPDEWSDFWREIQ